MKPVVSTKSGVISDGVAVIDGRFLLIVFASGGRVSGGSGGNDGILIDFARSAKSG